MSEGEDQDAPPPEAPPAAGEPRLPEGSEIAGLLGPNLRTPKGIPADYQPLESSTHELFFIELADFAGPLDLLLYLVRKHDLDILDIPIKFITDRYMEMLDALTALPIDIAAEFLVLAAELTHIKSKMLLPAREGVAVVQDEPEGDPREELIRRLLEYQKYKDAAGQLADRDQLGRDIFARVPPVIDTVDGDPGLKTISVFKLVEIMAGLVRRDEGHHTISFETFSLTERIDYILAFGAERDGRFTLVQLLQGMATRAELIMSFIAVLEMTRIGLIKILVEDAPAEGPPPAQKDSLDGALGKSEDERVREEAERALLELPTIWVVLTGKQLSGQVRDDYR